MLPNEITINRDDIMEIEQNMYGGIVVKAVIDPRRDYAFRGGKVPFNNKKLPRKYIINKGATILFWNNGEKTVVKRGKDDEYNKVLGFLWAYFQHTSGLSKTQANKYLAGLMDEDDIKVTKLISSGELNTLLSNVSSGIAEAFKNMADTLKK